MRFENEMVTWFILPTTHHTLNFVYKYLAGNQIFKILLSVVNKIILVMIIIDTNKYKYDKKEMCATCTHNTCVNLVIINLNNFKVNSNSH